MKSKKDNDEKVTSNKDLHRAAEGECQPIDTYYRITGPNEKLLLVIKRRVPFFLAKNRRDFKKAFNLDYHSPNRKHQSKMWQ